MHYYKTTTGQNFGAYQYEQIDDRLIEITEQEYLSNKEGE